MKQENNTKVNGGIGFVSLLQIAFIVLKVCNVITWNWFWVLFPTILSDGIIILILLICIIIAIITRNKH